MTQQNSPETCLLLENKRETEQQSKLMQRERREEAKQLNLYQGELGKKKRHTNDLWGKITTHTNQNKKTQTKLDFMVQRCRETTEQSSDWQALFTPREQRASNVTVLHWGINKQCHQGTRANACLYEDVIDGALMRIRLHNLRQALRLHGFCQSAVTTTERLSTTIKPNPLAKKPPFPQGFLLSVRLLRLQHQTTSPCLSCSFVNLS